MNRSTHLAQVLLLCHNTVSDGVQFVKNLLGHVKMHAQFARYVPAYLALLKVAQYGLSSKRCMKAPLRHYVQTPEATTVARCLAAVPRTQSPISQPAVCSLKAV